MTDNRTNEPRPNPTAEQIVRGVRKLLNRYSLRGDVPCDEIDKLIDDSEAGLLSEGTPSEAQARAIRKLDNVQAILAGAQASVTDAVRELSLTSAALTAAGVTPQVPNQNETKSGNNFVSLDPEKVAAMIRDDLRGGEYASAPDELPYAATSRRIARALCEAYKEGKLT